MALPRRLSEKSLKVLSLIASGYSYGQIVDGNPEINYHDIFAAAEEALRLNDTHSDYEERMANIKHNIPEPMSGGHKMKIAVLQQCSPRGCKSTSLPLDCSDSLPQSGLG